MPRSLPDLMTPQRLEQGYVIVLPGVEGHSFCNRDIVRGLVAAGLPYAIEIHNWTRGPLFPFYNLRSTKLHRRQSALIGEKIVNYRQAYPEQPIYLIGHSGGGAMSILALEGLPDDVKITGAVLIAAALSPDYDVSCALDQTTEGIWNVCSWGDLLFVGLFTTIVGTLDGRHRPAVGLTGFSLQVHQMVKDRGLPPLREIPYRWDYLRARNLSGHFGGTAPVFVRDHLAPLLRPCQTASPSASAV